MPLIRLAEHVLRREFSGSMIFHSFIFSINFRMDLYFCSQKIAFAVDIPEYIELFKVHTYYVV